MDVVGYDEAWVGWGGREREGSGREVRVLRVYTCFVF